MYKVLDLFSGIGGFSLGLERTGGFKTIAFCEIDPYCRKVLKKHWPDVICYHDIRKFTSEKFLSVHFAPEVICGGFPCQDISVAGKGAGIKGEKSGLWSEFARIIGEFRPRFVIVENVSALLSNGMGVLLGDLAALGYDAVWDCIPASAIGAPHRRDRVWIVAYAKGGRISRFKSSGGRPWGLGSCNWWASEPSVDRVAHGVPRRVDRLRALGNAVVPQIPELIGRAILALN